MISIPFSGSKRNWVGKVRELVRENGYDTVLEPFGGSCVLSANLYNEGLAQAYINDYDGLFDVYGEYLDIKDHIVEECLKRGLRPIKHTSKGDFRLERDGTRTPVPSRMLPEGEQKILQEIVSGVDPKWYRLLSYGANFCWPITTTHTKVRKEDFKLFGSRLETDKQREYLAVIKKMERDSMDWREFLKARESAYSEKTLIIADPPYPNVKQVQYKGKVDGAGTAEILEALRDSGCPFVFFGYDSKWLTQWFGSNGLKAEFDFLRQYNFKNQSYRYEWMAHVGRRK